MAGTSSHIHNGTIYRPLREQSVLRASPCRLVGDLINLFNLPFCKQTISKQKDCPFICVHLVDHSMAYTLLTGIIWSSTPHLSRNTWYLPIFNKKVISIFHSLCAHPLYIFHGQCLHPLTSRSITSHLQAEYYQGKKYLEIYPGYYNCPSSYLQYIFRSSGRQI